MILVDALTWVLKELGVEFVFGVSGANIEHLHDAIYRIGDNKISSILTKSEFSAAFMADGYARTHCTLGVCCSTSGGGMMNLAVGIAESYADQVPVLGIVGQPPRYLEGQGAFQDSSGYTNSVNALTLYSAITKYAAKMIEPNEFWPKLEKALKSIFGKSYGPAVLFIPRDLFEMEVPKRPNTFSLDLSDYQSYVAHDLDESVKKLLCYLKDARQPLIILGKFFKYSQACDSLIRFARTYNCKIATTLADVNAIGHTELNYIGMIGICGNEAAHKFIKEQADLVIVMEDDLSVMTTTDVLGALNNLPLVYIGRDSIKAYSAAKVDLSIETDLNALFNKLNLHSSEQKNCVNKTVKGLSRKSTPSILKANHPNKGLSVNLALGVIDKFLFKIDHCVFDAGNCVASALHYLQFPSGVTTTIALGMGGMGYGIPAGIGAQLGSRQNQQTMVFTGDGGFLISGLEIQTAVDYDLPILFVVFNNNKHGMCTTRQKLFFSNRVTASTYSQISIVNVVKGLGCPDKLWFNCADSIASLENSFDEYYANHNHKTGVIEIKITVDEDPPFIPFIRATNKRPLQKLVPSTIK